MPATIVDRQRRVILPVRRLARAAQRALDALGRPDGDVDVAVVDDGAIRALNAAHRGIRRRTDVLAFPLELADAASGLLRGSRELGQATWLPEEMQPLSSQRRCIRGTLEQVANLLVARRREIAQLRHREKPDYSARRPWGHGIDHGDRGAGQANTAGNGGSGG